MRACVCQSVCLSVCVWYTIFQLECDVCNANVVGIANFRKALNGWLVECTS